MQAGGLPTHGEVRNPLSNRSFRRTPEMSDFGHHARTRPLRDLFVIYSNEPLMIDKIPGLLPLGDIERSMLIFAHLPRRAQSCVDVASISPQSLEHHREH